MIKKTIDIDGATYNFHLTNEAWSVKFPKSYTHVKNMEQLEILGKAGSFFVPVNVLREEDTYIFEYEIDKTVYQFEDIYQMERVEKLRALQNIGKLQQFLHSRHTFFLHPDNLLFDMNLMPYVVHRGIKNILPPYNWEEEVFFQQYQCLIIAMFSKKYSFENLYSGSLHSVRGTQFEKNIVQAKSIAELLSILEEAFRKEKAIVKKNMMLVPKKRFRMFKGLAVGFIIAALLLAVPVSYFAFVNEPYQERLLTANENFLKTDYDKVITDLEKDDPTNLPLATQYELAYAYVQGEQLDDQKKENIMRNISLKSDKQYLLYWIYNGRGEFDESLDIAKLLDDVQLIIYSLAKQLEQVKNDGTLSGEERIEQQTEIEEELTKYTEQLTDEDASTDADTETDSDTETE